MKLTDKIEVSIEDIIAIAQLSEANGSEIIETYFLGDRDIPEERVQIYSKYTKCWYDCYVYPWLVDAACWTKFRIHPDGDTYANT